MTTPPPPDDDSPAYLLAVLFAAKKAKDRHLEQLTRHKLNALGVRVVFADVLAPGKGKGGTDDE